jgi:DNA-binding SARP family transcriptional activator/tetratricopeptide (TPR) repeat protein
MTRLVVRLLGDFQVSRGSSGAALPIRARKVRALLAYLALHPGRAHPRDRLSGLLWPDVGDLQARQSLRQALAGLRRTLWKTGALVVDADTVAMNPSRIDVDVPRFERLVAEASQAGLETAAGLYRGDLLDGFHVKASTFDDWLVTERERLRELARQALAKLLGHQTRAGSTEAAIHTARRLLSLDPLREDVHRAVMRLCVAQGHRGPALRQYQSCVSILRRELGVEPEPATRRLYQEILQQPLLRGAAGESRSQSELGSRHGPARSRSSREHGEPALIGRDAELARLRRVREDAWTRSAQAVLVTGEAGIGKTRVLEELAVEAAAAGGEVLVGRFHESEQALPFQGWIDALRRGDVLGSLGDLGAWRAELCRLFPELGSAPRTAGNPLRLLEAMFAVVDRRAAGRRLLVVLDDLHWADEMSLRLLSFIGRRVRRRPVLLVGSAREEELSEARTLRQALDELDRDGCLLRLGLSPLSQVHTVELVRALLRRGAAETSIERVGGEIWRTSEGNPFVIVETVREFVDSAGAPDAAAVVVPRRVRDLVAARLERLAEPARRLAAVAAVIGRDFSFALLQQSAGIPPAEVAEGLEELVRRRIVSAVGDGFDFTHERIRRIVYEGMFEPRRRTLHAAVGDALEALHVDHPAEVYDRLAFHALQAAQHERALDYLLHAADGARRTAAHRNEAALLGQALTIAEATGRRELIADLRARRGKAFARLGIWASARPDLEAGLAGLAEEMSERRAEVLVDLAEVCFWSLDVENLRRYATEAGRRAAETGRHELLPHVGGWLAMADNSDGQPVTSMRRVRDAVAQARELRIVPPGFVLALYSHLLGFVGELEQAVERGRKAVDVARQASDTANIMFALPHLGHALAGLGRYGEAEQVFAEARRFGREFRVGALLARAQAVSAGYHLDVFDFRGNEVIAEEARELARSFGFPPTLVSAGLDLLLNCARRHEVGKAEPLLAEITAAVEKAAGWHGWIWRLRLVEAHAELALARGDFQEAVRRATEAIAQNHGKKLKYEAAGLQTRARALHALGRTRGAIGDLRQAVQLARPTGDPAMFLRAAAALLAIEGDAALAAAAATAADHIASALPDGDMRQRFEASEPVRRVRKLAG